MVSTSASTLSSVASSIGMIAIANYISSPSSIGSEYNDMPIMIGPSSQTQPIPDNSDDPDYSVQTIWLYKPLKSKYSTCLKIK